MVGCGQWVVCGKLPTYLRHDQCSQAEHPPSETRCVSPCILTHRRRRVYDMHVFVRCVCVQDNVGCMRSSRSSRTVCMRINVVCKETHVAASRNFITTSVRARARACVRCDAAYRTCRSWSLERSGQTLDSRGPSPTQSYLESRVFKIWILSGEFLNVTLTQTKCTNYSLDTWRYEFSDDITFKHDRFWQTCERYSLPTPVGPKNRKTPFGRSFEAPRPVRLRRTLSEIALRT